jgi:protein-S-isoprenylcysteine O-methyltransferase Ste14
MYLAAPRLIPLLWLAWVLYWWVSSKRAKTVRRRESFGSRAAHLGPLAIAAFLLAAPALPFDLRFMPPGPGADWAGVAIVAFGLGFSVWARVVLGGNWSATVTLKQDHEMVRTGPYRYLRHPIYTGLLLALAGSALALGEWRGVLAVAIAAAALWRKLRLEERWLTEEFGSHYAEYRRATWALIPFVW